MNSGDNKVRNIYYMLCYVFWGENLFQFDENKYCSEKYENIYDFYTLLLCILLDRVIKKGTYKTYVECEDEISIVKGKIDFSRSISNLSLKRCKPICVYDDFSNNNLINQIIVTTIDKLIKNEKLGKKYKPRLNRFKAFYNDVDIIDTKSIKWNSIKYDRNNKAYNFIVYLCKMILDEVIVNDSSNIIPYKEFKDKQALDGLFERFLRKYISKNYSDYSVGSATLKYNELETYMFVPEMETDISIIDNTNRRVLVIDAKFKDSILGDSRGNYFTGRDDKIYKREDLFQINTYVENYKKITKTPKGEHYNEVYGCLLYAQTPDNPFKDSSYMMLNCNLIAVKTVDMTSEWKEIESKIKCIVDEFVYQKI